MKPAWLYLLAAMGVLIVAVGVAWIYPPAAVILIGSCLVALAFVVEVSE